MIGKFEGTYRFLSTFYRVTVWDEGLVYPTVEHAFQAAKTLDITLRIQIAALPYPAQAKRAGRELTLRTDWEQVRIDVMRRLIRTKFAAPSAFAVRLLSTGNNELVEGNTWGDTFWGVCRSEGQNWLGLLLMEQREALRTGEAA